MQWTSAASTRPSMEDAVEELTQRILDGLEGTRPDLTLVFASQHHLFHYTGLLPALHERLGDGLILGCSGGAVIGQGQELEDQPAITALAARLPEVSARLLTLENEDLPPLDGSPRPWVDMVGCEPEARPVFLVLAEPFSCDAETLLSGLDYAYPNSPKLGGLASGATGPGGNILFTNDTTRQRGAVVLVLQGDIELDTIVAQGCRPIGKTHHISECDGNLLQAIEGERPIDTLQELYAESDERDRHLMRTALFVGLVMDEMKDEPKPGDFLIRNVVGMDGEGGGIVVGAELRAGQTIQFHVRDRQTATDDLHRQLLGYCPMSPAGRSGAILFSCLGRGKGLFREENHDSRMFADEIGPLPLGGFFCNGEIGPIGGVTYLHGYTSAFGIFRPRGTGAQR